ncbi:hypothetical protein JX266_012097 [Neoarthrinium moseri]|nr:hypothetical protein JX266_012097 [Neoarthrinium moseri]
MPLPSPPASREPSPQEKTDPPKSLPLNQASANPKDTSTSNEDGSSSTDGSDSWDFITGDEMKYLLRDLIGVKPESKKVDMGKQLKREGWSVNLVADWHKRKGKNKGKKIYEDIKAEVADKSNGQETTSTETNGAGDSAPKGQGPNSTQTPSQDNGQETTSTETNGAGDSASKGQGPNSAKANGKTNAEAQQTDPQAEAKKLFAEVDAEIEAKSTWIKPYVGSTKQLPENIALYGTSNMRNMGDFDENEQKLYNDLCSFFRKEAPGRLLNFMIWLNNGLRISKGRALLEHLASDPPAVLRLLSEWDWERGKGDHQLVRDLQFDARTHFSSWQAQFPKFEQTFENLDIADGAQDSGGTQHPDGTQGQPSPTEVGLRQKRLAMRDWYFNPRTSAHNTLTIDDPMKAGVTMTGQILGRSAKRTSSMLVVFPSTKDRNYMSAIWVDGNEHREPLRNYARRGANLTLSIAKDKEFLDKCPSEEFEIIAVVQMEWGTSYHTHALGVPWADPDCTPMLFSKSVLASAWGTSTANAVIEQHMDSAGQENLATSTRSKNRIKARCWNP